MYLLFQPVVVLDDACHHHISTLHVEGDLSCGFVLENKTGRKHLRSWRSLTVQSHVRQCKPELSLMIPCCLEITYFGIHKWFHKVFENVITRKSSSRIPGFLSSAQPTKIELVTIRLSQRLLEAFSSDNFLSI